MSFTQLNTSKTNDFMEIKDMKELKWSKLDQYPRAQLYSIGFDLVVELNSKTRKNIELYSHKENLNSTFEN